MAHVYSDHVQESWSGTGAGNITPGGVPDSSYQAFSAVMSEGDTTDISIFGAGAFETCLATMTGGALVRGAIYASSNAGARVSFSAGTKTVIISLPAKKARFLSPPQGRLTLTSGTPVLTSTVSGAPTVYYTPYVGQLVPLFDGTSFSMDDVGGELSQSTTDSTKSPAAVAASKVYDLFAWRDSTTYRCTRGPAWTNDTTRGYTLTRQNGIWLNTSAITNGPAALRGTFVGTVMSNAASQIDFILGGTAAGGIAAVLGLWNAYNRLDIPFEVSDSTDSWTYASTAWRSANGSDAMRATIVRGLDEDAVPVDFGSIYTNGASSLAATAIGVDSTSVPAGVYGLIGGALSANANSVSVYRGRPGIGRHFFQALESVTTAAAAIFYGDAGGSVVRTGLTGTVRL